MHVTLTQSILICCNKHEYRSGPRKSPGGVMRGSASARLAGIVGSNTAGGDGCLSVANVACRQLEVSAPD